MLAVPALVGFARSHLGTYEPVWPVLGLLMVGAGLLAEATQRVVETRKAAALVDARSHASESEPAASAGDGRPTRQAGPEVVSPSQAPGAGAENAKADKTEHVKATSGWQRLVDPPGSDPPSS